MGGPEGGTDSIYYHVAEHASAQDSHRREPYSLEEKHGLRLTDWWNWGGIRGLTSLPCHWVKIPLRVSLKVVRGVCSGVFPSYSSKYLGFNFYSSPAFWDPIAAVNRGSPGE